MTGFNQDSLILRGGDKKDLEIDQKEDHAIEGEEEEGDLKEKKTKGSEKEEEKDICGGVIFFLVNSFCILAFFVPQIVISLEAQEIFNQNESKVSSFI